MGHFIREPYRVTNNIGNLDYRRHICILFIRLMVFLDTLIVRVLLDKHGVTITVKPILRINGMLIGFFYLFS